MQTVLQILFLVTLSNIVITNCSSFEIMKTCNLNILKRVEKLKFNTEAFITVAKTICQRRMERFHEYDVTLV